MEIRNSFEIALPVETVWAGFADVHGIAACLPGASIGDALPGGGYQGRLTVKLGPLSAAFNGELSIERREESKTAIVRGKGADGKSGTRVQATMTYAVTPAATPGGSRVDVVSEIVLAGSLAQFGKAAVMQEVAAQLSTEFARNFTVRMTAAGAARERVETAPHAPREAPGHELNVVALAFRIAWNRIKALFGPGKRSA